MARPSKSEAKRVAVLRRGPSDFAFRKLGEPHDMTGPIIDIRYVQLVDGRRIMQIARSPEKWQTPPTVMVQSLDDSERDEINEVLAAARNDPNLR